MLIELKNVLTLTLTYTDINIYIYTLMSQISFRKLTQICVFIPRVKNRVDISGRYARHNGIEMIV